jgi:hypothetical protein
MLNNVDSFTLQVALLAPELIIDYGIGDAIVDRRKRIAKHNKSEGLIMSLEDGARLMMIG